MKICQMTSAHPRYDTRIFVKECVSLSKNYDVSLIVADGKGNETKSNVKIYDVGKPSSRIKRMLFTTQRIYKKAIELDAQIYHFHDPELIAIGLKLIKKSKKVIYDVHEDVPYQLLNKPYLNKFLAKLISKIFEKYETYNVKKLSAIVCATPNIKDRLIKFNNNTISVCNYPKIDEFEQIQTNWEERKPEICYIGGISAIRGIKEIVIAAQTANVKIHIAGDFNSSQLEAQIRSLPSWQNVEFYGFVDRQKVCSILSKVKIGLVTLHPTASYLQAYPVKMFEYMAAGVPVLASNFELYKQIIDDAQCGDYADPLNPDEIASVIKKMLSDDTKLMQMSINGKRAVAEKYNWNIEEQKLLDLYKKILV